MNDTVITVQGRFSAFYPPERATVSVVVHHEADARQDAWEKTTAAASAIRDHIKSRVLEDKDASPVTWWSSDSVQVWSEKPWSADGAQLPLVYHSRVTVSAKFRDFQALASSLELLADIDGVSIDALSWALTDGRTTTVTAEVRSRAVKDAVAKASVYAQSIGLGTVRAVAIADPGMLGDQVHSGATDGAVYLTRASKSMDSGSAPTLSLKPEDIEVSAIVDARFIAS
ncbi:SIMPL domain-containing protein [Glaciihabitans sp. dw_435]|uniref:SIMPL domain-containing protein n=1 Tax=Glaciihabitans sp. dw_435 TaxID=2720081 RepID=UPI001BD3F33C|nr:SIMPL domain-containing protein [Glaciihabitans sp. dw_435]